ncbi:hypothetical protein K7432_005903 [Basidiobolus ranarum]|uniref:LIM zinc-binding domain-containing protein n=1 Tax=Basidiobolus ranarum TaxID=34480 RepID=A0ABR2W2J0_9FUNG
MRNSLSPGLSDVASSRKRTASLEEFEQPSSKRITSDIRRYYETGLPQHTHTRASLVPSEKRRVSGVDIHSLIAKFDNGQTPKRYRRSSQFSQDSRLSLSVGSTHSSIDLPLDVPAAEDIRPKIRDFKDDEELFGPTKVKVSPVGSVFPKPHCIDILRSRHSVNRHEPSADSKFEHSTPSTFLHSRKEEPERGSRCSICCRVMTPDSRTYAIVDGEYYCPAHFSLTIPVSLL